MNRPAPRLWGRGSDFAEAKVDPKDKETIYIANVAFYKSSDGGRSVTCIKGAPGGDDYHTVWISPDDSKIMLLAGDQGAVVTVNGGTTWSSWYNQPTAQFYHVITDNCFPYWVYGAQQETGGVLSPMRAKPASAASVPSSAICLQSCKAPMPHRRRRPLPPSPLFAKISKG